MSGTVASAVSVAECADDVFCKLRESFEPSDETKMQSKECQSEIEKISFKSFDQKHSCKSVKGIPMEQFEAFALRLKKRLGLSDEVHESILDGLYVGENKEKLSEFHFKDGKGDIHHGRLITLKRNDKMDVAYAVYTLSFELTEKETKHDSCEWWFYVVPVTSTTTEKEIQTLNEDEKNKFSQWCEMKLYHCVVDECPKNDK